jgi:hypothetical protein
LSRQLEWGSKIIWILTYSWTGNFLLAWAGQIAGIENQTMHRFEQYLKILQLYYENSRFPPIMLCLAEAVLRNSRYFCMNPYWISTRKVKNNLWSPLLNYRGNLMKTQGSHPVSNFEA